MHFGASGQSNEKDAMKIKDKNAYSMPQATAFDFAQEWHKEQHVLANKLCSKFYNCIKNTQEMINKA